MTPDTFALWLFNAKPKQSTVYYTGFLAKDRQSGTISPDASATASDAFRAAIAGTLCLTQRRLGVGVFEYVATRCA